MLNFLGVAENFSVLAESRWTSTFLFVDELTDAPARLDGVTFEGWVSALGGKCDILFTRAEGDSTGHQVAVSFPPLPEGRWPYEIFCVADSGEKVRLLSGYVDAVGDLDVSSGKLYMTRTLEVRLPGDATARIALEWQATTAAQLAAAEARRALDAVLMEAGAAEETLRRVEEVAGQVEDAGDAARRAEEAAAEAKRIADEAPREYVPTISPDGFWVINGVKTPARAVPKDGVNGADAVTVVRHFVADVMEIPSEGPTCSGGHLYYVAAEDELPEARVTVLPGFAEVERVSLAVNGVPIPLPPRSGSPEVYARTLAGAIEACHLDAVGVRVEGPTVVLSSANELLTVTREGESALAVFERPMLYQGACPCYAWCVDADGVGGWRRIDADGMMTAGNGGSGNGFGGGSMKPATAEAYGSAKLATDVPVADGAPVGVNAFGQLCAARASFDWPGGVLLSASGTIADGVPVGVDAEGRLVASPQSAAAATLFRFGNVKLGSEFDVINAIPYQIGVAATADGRLANNLLTYGALKNMMRPGWRGAGWNDEAHELSERSYFLGVHTSSSFLQSEERGLELNMATSAVPGGVCLTSSLDEERRAYVLDATALKALLDSFYYTAAQTEARLENFIETNTTLFDVRIMKTEEFDALASIDAHCLYLVY